MSLQLVNHFHLNPYLCSAFIIQGMLSLQMTKTEEQLTLVINIHKEIEQNKSRSMNNLKKIYIVLART